LKALSAVRSRVDQHIEAKLHPMLAPNNTGAAQLPLPGRGMPLVAAELVAE
jgi:hypothetical protein